MHGSGFQAVQRSWSVPHRLRVRLRRRSGERLQGRGQAVPCLVAMCMRFAKQQVGRDIKPIVCSVCGAWCMDSQHCAAGI